jgi:hypothetical protein
MESGETNIEWASPSIIKRSRCESKSVLRRRDSRREGPRRVGEMFIDPSRRQVRIGDRPVELANKEFGSFEGYPACLSGDKG